MKSSSFARELGDMVGELHELAGLVQVKPMKEKKVKAKEVITDSAIRKLLSMVRSLPEPKGSDKVQSISVKLAGGLYLQGNIGIVEADMMHWVTLAFPCGPCLAQDVVKQLKEVET